MILHGVMSLGKAKSVNQNGEHYISHRYPRGGVIFSGGLKSIAVSIAVNAFISVLNPEISPDCPFCGQRETVFHAFMYCCRLRPLFHVLENLLTSFNEVFSMQMFICGFKYVRRRSFECQLLNCFGSVKNGNLHKQAE